MRFVKVGIGNPDTKIGDFSANRAKIEAMALEMARAKCTLAVFPEQSIAGYPSEDLTQWGKYVEGQWRELTQLAKFTRRLPFPTVLAVGLTVAHRGNLYNCAALISKGEVVALVPKMGLPTYGVFYEGRVFSYGVPGYVSEVGGIPFGDVIVRFPFGVVSVEVCEDIWSPDGPIMRRSYSGAEMTLNLSASPFRFGVVGTREEMLPTRSADAQSVLVYANMVGGNDGLVFDGGGYVHQNGRRLHKAPRWREGFSTQVVDLDLTATQRQINSTWRHDATEFLASGKVVTEITAEGPEPNDPEYRYPVPKGRSFFMPASEERLDPLRQYFEDMIEAMLTGLSGYFTKTGAFEKIIIALSGGKDSALSLVIAYLYAQRRFAKLGKTERLEAIRDFIVCYSMPTRFNSETTRSLARRLAEDLGVSFFEEPIEEAFESEVAALARMLPLGRLEGDLTRQNIQPRIRGARMWNLAGELKALWLQTGNMSERAVGYTTMGGDIEGAYSLLGNLPKSVINRLLLYLAEKYAWPSLRDLTETKASAELTEGQEDEKDLMPFPVLDACLYLLAGERRTPTEIYQILKEMWTEAELRAMDASYEAGDLKKWVAKFTRLFFASIFKWVQSPLTVHLGSLDLDRERALQLPVAAGGWLKEELLKLEEME